MSFAIRGGLIVGVALLIYSIAANESESIYFWIFLLC